VDRELEEILVNELKVPENALHPETSLADAGLDSIAMVELSIMISDRLGVQVSEEELRDVGKIGQLQPLIEQKRANGARP
jgi:acyl carrier protein